MAYTVEYKDKGFYLTHTGVMSLEEIDAGNALILGSEKFDDHKYQIIDLLAADFSEIKHTQAQKTGAMDFAGSKIAPSIKVALVVGDSASEKFCKEYISTTKMLGSTWGFELFSDIESALEWAIN